MPQMTPAHLQSVHEEDNNSDQQSFRVNEETAARVKL